MIVIKGIDGVSKWDRVGHEYSFRTTGKDHHFLSRRGQPDFINSVLPNFSTQLIDV